MRIVLLGGSGFIGTNLVKALALDEKNRIIVVDRHRNDRKYIDNNAYSNVKYIEADLNIETDLREYLLESDIVFHLISTTVPTTANINISEEITSNVVFSAKLFEACIKYNVKKVVFLSSGGTVYGRDSKCPLSEESITNPISSYGMQKLSIEKLLYIYNHVYDLDYRIIRLSNPYGPYQRHDGIQGAVSTFIYKTLTAQEIEVYGDGSNVRDFIYIDDAINGIMKIVNGDSSYRLFNLGSGHGTSINQLIATIVNSLGIQPRIVYEKSRGVDVPSNYLDIRRYEMVYGDLAPISLEEGIKKTAKFMRDYYSI